MKTLQDLFFASQKWQNKTAFVHRTGIRRLVFSYSDFYQLSLKAAAWLEQRNIGKGDRVVIWAPNSPWWVVAFFGVILRGGIVVPVDFASGKERAEKIAELTQSKLVFQSINKLEKIDKFNNVFIEDLKFLIEDKTASSNIVGVSENDIAELIYTSGTTGDPKGVILTHKNLITNLLQVNQHIPIVTQDYNFLSLLPLSHMFEQMGGLLTPLYRGSSIVYIATLKPSAIMQALSLENIYAMIIVPRLLQALKNSIEAKLENKKLVRQFKRLIKFLVSRKLGRNFKFFISGGSALGLDLGKFWQNLSFVVIEGYGLTECSPVLTANYFDKQKLGSVGKALPGVVLKIISGGEILAKGENVFGGYWHNEAATREVFNEEGWFKTGDLGAIDWEGWLYIKGRKKDLVVTGAGINVYPEDIEVVLNNLPGVKESCVVGKSGSEGEQVHAVLILDESGKAPEAIVREANLKLDSLQQIASWSVWPQGEFPKTATLKIQKFLVREAVLKSSTGDFSQSTDKLINLIAKATGRPAITVNENSVLVQDLGLTSVARLELVNYLEQEFRVDLDDTLIDQNTTVGFLRKTIKARGKVSSGNFSYWPNTRFGRLIRVICNWAINYPIFFSFVKLEKKGLENLTLLNGPALFIANHISYFDHPAVAFSMPRVIRYSTATAAKSEFFHEDKKASKLKWFWKRFTYYYSLVAFNVFPLPRIAGFRKSLEFMGKLIDNKVNILIFPEGTRSYDGKLLAFMDGLGIVVKELQVPVVPVKIEGIEKVFPRGTAIPKRGAVTVTFGKPHCFKQESPSQIVEISKNLVASL